MPILERTLGLLALVSVLVSVTTTVWLVRRRVPEWLYADAALPLAASIAWVASLGSLAMSEIAGYVPCVLCWYQRIAMYPLAIILTVAATRRDRHVWLTAIPIAGIGAIISIWHIAIEQRPELGGDVCDPVAPCSLRWVEEFGFLTLPTMALIGFLTISVLVVAARPKRRNPQDT